MSAGHYSLRWTWQQNSVVRSACEQ